MSVQITDQEVKRFVNGVQMRVSANEDAVRAAIAKIVEAHLPAPCEDADKVISGAFEAAAQVEESRPWGEVPAREWRGYITSSHPALVAFRNHIRQHWPRLATEEEANKLDKTPGDWDDPITWRWQTSNGSKVRYIAFRGRGETLQWRYYEHGVASSNWSVTKPAHEALGVPSKWNTCSCPDFAKQQYAAEKAKQQDMLRAAKATEDRGCTTTLRDTPQSEPSPAAARLTAKKDDEIARLQQQLEASRKHSRDCQAVITRRNATIRELEYRAARIPPATFQRYFAHRKEFLDFGLYIRMDRDNKFKIVAKDGGVVRSVVQRTLRECLQYVDKKIWREVPAVEAQAEQIRRLISEVERLRNENARIDGERLASGERNQ